MGPDLDLKRESENAMEVSPCKRGNSSKISEKVVTSPNDCEDNNSDVEGSVNKHVMVPGRSEDTEVNVIDSINSVDKGLVFSECREETESSSSFGDTDSGARNGAVSDGLEVESEMRDDCTSLLAFDRFDDLLMRKKKLTPHWKRFIHPLMWRLKWTELKIRELEEQAGNYGKRIAEYGQRKEQELQKLMVEDLSVKATPFSFQSPRVNMVKRRKRKHVEEAINISPYTSHHNLFSYHVNKGSHADGARMADAFGISVKPETKTNYTSDEFGVNGGWSYLEYKDDKMLEEMFRNIELMKLQLHALKIRVDKVVNENADRISSSQCLLASCDAPISSALKASSQIHREVATGSLFIPSLSTSDNRGDIVVPDTGVSSYREVTTFPDTIESADHSHMRLPSDNVEDEILIYNNNHPIKEVTGVRIQPAVTSQPLSASLAVNDAHQAQEQEPVSQGKRASQQSSKVRSISMLNNTKSKRKCTRRKGRSSTWTR